jgi:hypothetical protein
MANPESFVSPRRGGGTGAAAILQPSTALKDIFTTYDAQRKQSPDAYYDSLGNDIKQDFDIGKGITNAADKLAIKSQLDKMINQQANIYYSRKNFAQAPDEYKKYYEERQRTTDLSSKALRDEATYNAIAKEVAAKDYKYDKEKSLENINKWREIPLEQRPPRPELVFIDQSNYNKMFKDFGNKSHIVEDVNGSYVDGTGATVRRVSFSEPNARKDWQITVANNPNTADMRRIFALATDKAQEAAAQQQADWNTLPADVRHEMVNAEAEDMYVDAMRATLQQKSSTITTVNASKGGSGKRDPKEFINQFKITPLIEGNNLKRVVNLELLGFENTEKNNAIQELQGANVGKVVIGRPQRISQVEGQPAYIEVAVTSKDGNPSLEYVPYTKNKEKVQKLYRVDFDADRPKEFKSQYENYQAPMALSRSKETTDEEYARALKEKRPIIERFNKRKKTTEAAPASKVTGKKDRVAPPNEM